MHVDINYCQSWGLRKNMFSCILRSTGTVAFLDMNEQICDARYDCLSSGLEIKKIVRSPFGD